MRTVVVRDYAEWRDVARSFAQQGVTPQEIVWRDVNESRQRLFDDTELSPPNKQLGSAPREVNGVASQPLRVPQAFLDAAEYVACHRDECRWELLYRMLWRLTHGTPELLSLATDDDVITFKRFASAVRRDAHKMKAFVRFRRLGSPESDESFVAWHRPDHRIVGLVAPFFVRRFGVMKWAIMTPDATALWDGQLLQFGTGVASDRGLQRDALEELWRTYYAAIFNPARVNRKAMTREMAVRHWPTLPEADSIPELMRAASQRVETMLETTEGFAMSAAEFLPPTEDLKSLREAAASCEGCPLYKDATQTVFGKGPEHARLVLVGEVPGDMEDRQGEPFVGPAGKLLNDALDEAGIERDTVYVTNAVKHFKFKVVGGGRRLHQKPGIREMKACKPWLEAELEAIQPDVIVCLGATAAQSVIATDFRITKQRGELFHTDYAPATLATYHPSAILRAPDKDARAKMYAMLVEDLQTAARHLDTAEVDMVEHDVK